MVFLQSSGPNTVSLIIGGIGVLASAGAIGWFMRFNTRLTIAEKDSSKAVVETEKQGKAVAVLENRMSTMEGTFREIKEKVDLLPELKAMLGAMQNAIEKILPRQIESLAEEVRDTRNVAQDALVKANTALEYTKA